VRACNSQWCVHGALINRGCLDYVGLCGGRADVDVRDEDGKTAMLYACEGESPMSVVSLVQAGCDVKSPCGPKGRLPIDFAASHQLKHVGPICSCQHVRGQTPADVRVVLMSVCGGRLS